MLHFARRPKTDSDHPEAVYHCTGGSQLKKFISALILTIALVASVGSVSWGNDATFEGGTWEGGTWEGIDLGGTWE